MIEQRTGKVCNQTVHGGESIARFPRYGCTPSWSPRRSLSLQQPRQPSKMQQSHAALEGFQRPSTLLGPTQSCLSARGLGGDERYHTERLIERLVMGSRMSIYRRRAHGLWIYSGYWHRHAMSIALRMHWPGPKTRLVTRAYQRRPIRSRLLSLYPFNSPSPSTCDLRSALLSTSFNECND